MFRPISPIISAETTLPLESSYYAWGDYRYVVICKRRLHVAWNTKVVGSSFKQYCLCHAFDRRRYGYQGKMILLKYLHLSFNRYVPVRSRPSNPIHFFRDICQPSSPFYHLLPHLRKYISLVCAQNSHTVHAPYPTHQKSCSCINCALNHYQVGTHNN